MAVEHRWSMRKELSLNVSLYYPPIGMVNGRTRNISLEGMFVATRGITIPAQARLEVSFVTESGGRQIEHRMPAYVIHSGTEGVGLMLQHVGQREFNALRYMLNAA